MSLRSASCCRQIARPAPVGRSVRTTPSPWTCLWTALGLLSTSIPATAQERPHPAAPAGIPVRYVEGTVHGFLQLSTADGKPLADGDLLQVVRDTIIESRMVFVFTDSSAFEESVAFTQRNTFTMLTYHLLQRGPAFAMDLDVTLTHSGDYRVTATSHKDGKQKHYSGRLDLPSDIYNGMIITVAKNLSPGAPRKVHVVAFTPRPRVIGLELTGASAPPTMVGQRVESTVRFTLKPKLGALLHFFATLLGKMPPDSYAWILTQDVPAFVRFEGPMYSGPVWHLESISPTVPHSAPPRSPR